MGSKKIMKDRIRWWVNNRIDNNQNALIMITGGTGSGKSYSALRMAEEYASDRGTEFLVAGNVAFNVESFMYILNMLKPPSGSVLVFDEFGVGMSSKRSLTTANTIFGFLLQTFRHKNYIVIFTSPHLGFIDKTARVLFHLWLETKKIDRGKQEVVLTPRMPTSNQKDGTLDWKLLKLGNNVLLGSYNVSLPSQKVIDDYEIRKSEYTTGLNDKILDSLGDVDAWGSKKRGRR